LWGRDLLVAPVVEQGSTSRKVYLPRGDWYDFWTSERAHGGAEIQRAVDLETMPLYVRAGAILPLGPLRQYVGEKVDEPLSVSIYPGADSSFLLYEDDGKSFNYRHGDWMGLQMEWRDSQRKLKLSLASGSRMLTPVAMPINVRLEQTTKKVLFAGKPLELSFR
jgi:alpha-glucosidase/alpha-D-xyloside xylohydrolase